MANSNVDGSITIEVDLDDKEATKELNQLRREIKSLEKSIEDMRIRRSPLAEQMEEYAAQLDRAKAKLAELKQTETSMPGRSFVGEELPKIKKEIVNLRKNIEETEAKRSTLAGQMDEYAASIESAKAKLAELTYMHEQDAHISKYVRNYERMAAKDPNFIGDSKFYEETSRIRDIGIERSDEPQTDMAKRRIEIERLEKAWADAKAEAELYQKQISDASQR